VPVFVAFGWCVLGHIVETRRTPKELVFFESPNSFRAAFATVTCVLLIYLFAPTDVSPFIYFQF
jgi:hypothetical protein